MTPEIESAIKDLIAECITLGKFPSYSGGELAEELRKLHAAITQSLAAERERCAQVADGHRDKAGTAYYVCDFIAAAIRSLE